MKDLKTIIDELEDEIKARHDLMTKMVGSLYPLMVASEIEKLRTAREALK